MFKRTYVTGAKFEQDFDFVLKLGFHEMSSQFYGHHKALAGTGKFLSIPITTFY